jgi:Kef-type K+ transport system membrane component KefB
MNDMDGPNQVCAWRRAGVCPGISCIDNRKPGERYVVGGGSPTPERGPWAGAGPRPRQRPLMLADHPILVVLALAVVAPLLAEIPIGLRVPVVALEVLLGILVGPHVLGLVQPSGSLLSAFLSVMFLIGVAATLFMAGMEIDFGQVRGRPLSRALVGLAVVVGLGARPPRLISLLSRTLQTSSQLPVRLALLVVSAFIVLALDFGFEGILGAFAAGMVVGLATRGQEGKPFRVKIDAVCFGWFTPFFFVGTGIQFDLGALARKATTMLLVPAFLVMLLLVRGVPVFLYRDDIPKLERLPFALSASVASLGLIVVITRIGLQAKNMNPEIAQALVGAALLSLLLYPMLAGVLLSRTVGSAPHADRA